MNLRVGFSKISNLNPSRAPTSPFNHANKSKELLPYKFYFQQLQTISTESNVKATISNFVASVILLMQHLNWRKYNSYASKI